MEQKDILLGALEYYGIAVAGINGAKIITAKGYEIEIEQNGIFKLLENGMVIAPFDDLDELCRFVLL